jgi:hypothetical protein
VSDEETFKVTDRRGRGERPPASAPTSSAAPPSVGPSDRVDSGAVTSASSELGALFMMFAGSALVSLGEEPEPGTEQHHVDLGQAQASIDVLLMLRDKTRGNRTEQESHLLDGILYDLQMRFVRAARGRSPGG